MSDSNRFIIITAESLQFFQLFFEGVICDNVHLAFIVNGEQVDGGVSDFDVGDYAGTAGFSFSF